MEKANELTNWKYQLYFDVIKAYKNGAKEHPQAEMKKFIDKMKDKEIDIEILEQKAILMADCWLFLIRCSTPWLGEYLPNYIIHQGFGNDREGLYE